MNNLFLKETLADKTFTSDDGKSYKCKICEKTFTDEGQIVLSSDYCAMMEHIDTHVAEMFDEFIKTKAAKK